MVNFEGLSLDERARIVWEGRYVETINYYGFKHNLYTLPTGQWAEVLYDSTSNEIVDIRLVTGETLPKYFNRVILDL
jgi:hypothetical protein